MDHWDCEKQTHSSILIFWTDRSGTLRCPGVRAADPSGKGSASPLLLNRSNSDIARSFQPVTARGAAFAQGNQICSICAQAISSDRC